jgi:hypothetical protein
VHHGPLPQIPRASALALGSTAPSAGFNMTNLLFDRALTDGEIVSIIRDLAAAAGRARNAVRTRKSLTLSLPEGDNRPSALPGRNLRRRVLCTPIATEA